MDLGEYRPILSGLIGGVIATMMCSAWARWLPKGMNGKEPQTLQFEHRWAVRLANVAFFAGIACGLWMYGWGGYASNDWRPLAVTIGAAFSLPLLILALVTWFRRAPIGEAYAAYALNQRMPMWVLYPLSLLGLPLFAWGLASLL
ncbi:MAG: hypothetical protein GXC94_14160 [Comamonadaceae bacterium]|jgi:hypothetical protein|nr:hypothetical protein [Comamonadaceae bacterium]